MYMPAAIPSPPFQPASLPANLMDLYQALAKARNNSSQREAAIHIIHAYFKHYGPTGMRPALWQLLSGAMGQGLFKKKGKRRELLLFYEFTLLLIDAASVIDVVTKEEK